MEQELSLEACDWFKLSSWTKNIKTLFNVKESSCYLVAYRQRLVSVSVKSASWVDTSGPLDVGIYRSIVMCLCNRIQDQSLTFPADSFRKYGVYPVWKKFDNLLWIHFLSRVRRYFDIVWPQFQERLKRGIMVAFSNLGRFAWLKRVIHLSSCSWFMCTKVWLPSKWQLFTWLTAQIISWSNWHY